MQWAAVRTQQELRTIPPQEWIKEWVLFLRRVCNETCQGWVPGLAFFPPKILDAILLCHIFPQTEKSFSEESGVVTGTVSVTGSGVVKTVRVWKIFQLGMMLVEGVGSGRVRSKKEWKRNNEECVPGCPWQRLTLQTSQAIVLLYLMKHQGWFSPSGFLDEWIFSTYLFTVIYICIISKFFLYYNVI